MGRNNQCWQIHMKFYHRFLLIKMRQYYLFYPLKQLNLNFAKKPVLYHLFYIIFYKTSLLNLMNCKSKQYWNISQAKMWKDKSKAQSLCFDNFHWFWQHNFDIVYFFNKIKLKPWRDLKVCIDLVGYGNLWAKEVQNN